MSHNALAEVVGIPTLHTVSAGLTAISIGGAWGYVSGAVGVLPIVIAGGAGIAAIVSYTFSTLDSPTFQRRVSRWQFRRKQRLLEKLRKQQIVLTAKLQALDTIEHAHEAAEKIITDAKQGVLCPPTSKPPK